MKYFNDNAAFCCYIAETELRKQKIEKIIQKLAAAGEYLAYDFTYQCKVYDSLNFDSDTLTEEEINYMEQKLALYFS